MQADKGCKKRGSEPTNHHCCEQERSPFPRGHADPLCPSRPSSNRILPWPCIEPGARAEQWRYGVGLAPFPLQPDATRMLAALTVLR